MPPPPIQAADVVVWRPDGGAVARPAVLRNVQIRLDSERALTELLAEIRSRTGATVALLRLAATVVHVELLSGGDGFEWRVPDTEIGGQSPWNRVGWFGATVDLISATLAQRAGATISGGFEQVKHWSISALLRVETDQGTFWFKQVPPFMAHEGPLVRWLGDLRPGLAPEVVALGSDWMLTRAFGPPGDGDETANPYATLASLQQDAAPKAGELLALGCPDRRLSGLGSEVRALMARSDLLDAEARQKLAAVLPDLLVSIEQLDGSVPASLVHGDLHGGNWLRNADGSWLIFDWTDGCVSHPFMDLGVLDGIAEASKRAACRTDYLRVWRDFVDAPTLQRTVAAAAPVAAAFHALSYQRIADNVAADDREMWVKVLHWYLRKLFGLLSRADS